MILPRRRLIGLALAPLALSAAWVVSDGAWGPMIAADALLVLVAALDALAARGAVEVSRSAPGVWSVGRAVAGATTVRNVGRRGLWMELFDQLPGVVEGLPAEAWVPAGEAVEMGWKATVSARGRYTLGPAAVRWRSPLGLWSRQQRHAVEGAVRVFPDFSWLRRQLKAARVDEQRLPVRVRRRPGGENEFERNRPYQTGDPIRHMDWKATARKQRLVVREFGQEANQNLLFLLDCGRMSGARLGELTALDQAVNASLALAHVALRRGDRVGLMAFDRQPRVWVAPGGGVRQAHRLVQATYTVASSDDDPDYGAALRYLAGSVRRRSLVVVITAVQDALNAAAVAAIVRAMRGRHLPVLVWLRDPALDALADGEAADDEAFFVRSAAAEQVAWRERQLAELRRMGILIVDCPAERLGAALLERYIEIKARRLL